MSGEEKEEYVLNFNIIHGWNLILIKDYFVDIRGPRQQTGAGQREMRGSLTAEALGSISISLCNT